MFGMSLNCTNVHLYPKEDAEEFAFNLGTEQPVEMPDSTAVVVPPCGDDKTEVEEGEICEDTRPAKRSKIEE